MSDDLHYIDRLFKKAIEGEEEAPPPGVWEQIDKRLEKNTVVSITRKYGTLKRIAVALFAFAFALGMYALHIADTNRQRQNAVVKTGNQNKAAATIKKEKINTANQRNDTISAAHKQYNKVFSDSTVRTNITHLPLKSYKTRQYEVTAGNNIESQMVNRDMALPNAVEQGVNKIVAANDQSNKKAATESSYVTPAETVTIPNPPVLKPSIAKLLTTTRDSNKLLSGLNSTTPIVAVPHIAVHRIQNKGAISLTIFFSAAQSKNRIANPAPALPRERIRDEFQRKEQDGTSFTVGILAIYPIATKWSLQPGITFSSSSIHIAPKTIYAQHDSQGRIRYRYNSSCGYIYIEPGQGIMPAVGDSVLSPSAKNILNYVGIPLQLSYAVEMGRITIAPTIGVAANFLTKGGLQTASPNSTQKNKQEPMQGLKATYFSGLTTVGLEYKVNPHFSIGMAPTIRFALSSINKQSPVQSYPGSVGIDAGLHIHF